MNRSLFVPLLVCVLFICAGTVAGAPIGSAFPQQDIDPDDVLMSITVEDNGDAVWTIEYRTRLETDEDEQAFGDLKRDVEADPESYAGRFRDRMNGTAASAENATGREMAITEMTVSAENRSLPQEYGVLRYRFRWSNFAAVDGDRLAVGDAVGGLFLDDETALLISWPDGYDLLDASPEPTETRSESIVYEGPTDFASDEPRLELALTETVPSDDDGDASPDTTDQVPNWVTAVVALAALLGGGAFLFFRRHEGGMKSAEGDESGPEPRAESDTDPSAEAAASERDEELLSNGEQVLQLIESEGGRMKQQAVAERLGWTDAKTSQVTKKLRENDELEGFRLGRENVLSLPEEGSDSELQ